MTIFYAVVLLGILIFVHEVGHFLLAKLLGVKVLKFSLGFGPKVLGKVYGDTEYLLSAVPLGGYVKMLGEEPGEEELGEDEKKMAYNHQPVWKRFAIVFSGPLFNLCFAGLVFILIYYSGIPVSYPDIGKISAGSPAQKAGLMTGDRVAEINGKTVMSWDEIEKIVSSSNGEALNLAVDRQGKKLEIRVTPEQRSEKDVFGEMRDNWYVGMSPLLSPKVGEVMKGSRAEKAGIMKGDVITGIEGAAPATWEDMTTLIHENPERPLHFEVKRGEELKEFTITPSKKTLKSPDGKEKVIGLIGIKPAGNDFIKRYGVADSLALGLTRTWDVIVITFVSIAKLIQRVIPADTIGGPILIFQMAGEQAAHGALNFFTFMAVISINLGVLNLLPIPVLDGGHLLFLSIEAIRKRPLNEKVIMVAQRVGLTLLIMLMVFALYNDILRLFNGKIFPE